MMLSPSTYESRACPTLSIPHNPSTPLHLASGSSSRPFAIDLSVPPAYPAPSRLPVCPRKCKRSPPLPHKRIPHTKAQTRGRCGSRRGSENRHEDVPHLTLHARTLRLAHSTTDVFVAHAASDTAYPRVPPAHAGSAEWTALFLARGHAHAPPPAASRTNNNHKGSDANAGEGAGRGNGERKRAVPRHLTPYHPTIAFYISIHICTLALVSTPKYVLFYHQVLLSPLSSFASISTRTSRARRAARGNHRLSGRVLGDTLVAQRLRRGENGRDPRGYSLGRVLITCVSCAGRCGHARTQGVTGCTCIAIFTRCPKHEGGKENEGGYGERAEGGTEEERRR
ncbi:hypothetical protein EDB85DRAFT_352220 [Lactarius pseudohatsudake]|nr:hypothetical protein EDB85DRAFT_352220 [Lactarius pseudohatsudake]